jgi:drug/metabolite transporter (DMT)-like permease
MNKKFVLGVFFVIIGACSYGVLATLVKLAYEEGFTTTEVTSSQYLIGLTVLGIISLLTKNKSAKKPHPRSIPKLIVAGTSLGLTGLFYYLSVKYIPVSVAIILLMQSTWLGVVAEVIIKKQLPSIKKIIVSIVICGGTFLAAGVLDRSVEFHFIGFLFGFLAALSYTMTIISSANIGLDIHGVHRSFWFSCGGTLIILIVASFHLQENFNLAVFLKWGPILALFGTILPPLCFSFGMPKIGVGLGTILGAMELPVSVLCAGFLLTEEVDMLRWLGIGIILMAILVMNISFNNKQKESVA